MCGKERERTKRGIFILAIFIFIMIVNLCSKREGKGITMNIRDLLKRLSKYFAYFKVEIFMKC